MSIRKKTIIFFTVIFTSLMIISTLVLDLIITSQFGSLENVTAKEISGHNKEILNFSLKSMLPFIKDWAVWDSMYNYVEDKDKDFEESDLGITTLDTLNIDALAICDLNKETVYTISRPELSEFNEILRKLKPIVSLSEQSPSFSGYVAISDNVFYFGAHSILKRNGEGPAAGTFIVLRSVEMQDPTQDPYLQTIASNIKLYSLKEPANLTKYGNIINALDLETSVVKVENSNLLYSYSMVEDVFGDPVILIESSYTRYVSSEGNFVKNLAIATITIIIIIAGVLSYLNFEHEFLRSISKLTHFMKSVIDNPQTKERLALHTNSEMTTLSDTVNSMLDKIREQQKELEQSNLNLAQTNQAIAEKQAELAKINQDLSELNKAMLGREMKMVELKREVELLRARTGQTPLV